MNITRYLLIFISVYFTLQLTLIYAIDHKNSLTQKHQDLIKLAQLKSTHVRHVIKTLEQVGGSYKLINTTPNELKTILGKELSDFDTLISINLAQSGMSVKKKREHDPFDENFYKHVGEILDIESITILHTKVKHNHWLKPLGNLVELKELKIINQGALKDEGLTYFGNLKKLERLFYVGTHFTGRAFDSFETMPYLTYASFRGSKIDDEGLRIICERLPNLEFISLAHAHFSDAGAIHLKKLTKLKKIELASRKATPACLQHISSLSIESLQTGDGLGAPECLPIIAKMDSLKHLTLTRANSLSINDLSRVSQMTHIRSLELGKLEASDEYISVFKKMSHLKKLRLANYGKPFPDEFITKVSQVLPHTELLFR